MISWVLCATYAIAAVAGEESASAFVAPARLEQARARATTFPWARDVAERLRAEADDLVHEPLDIPRAGGQWSHWYTCAEDGSKLEAESPTRHVCPTCGRAYSGYLYDAVYVAQRHQRWLGGVETLGLAYALDSDLAFAARARAILCAYAAFYEDLPLHDIRGGRGSAKARLFPQTLTEAAILCQVCLGYDLVRSASCFDETDRRLIEEQLLRPMVSTIRANNRRASNWQAWHNAAIGCAGFVLKDRRLVRRAVNGPSGLRYQLRHSVLPRGMWYEGSPIYHAYALEAYSYLFLAAERAGWELHRDAQVKRMFDAPLRLVLPDGTLPPLNDSDRIPLSDWRALYELAYAWYGDPRYVPMLEPRDSNRALFWGVDALPPSPPFSPVLTSSNDAAEGLAILRSLGGESALYLDYGPERSGHMHPARLNVLLYAQGDVRLVDPGRQAYGHPMHKGWYEQTIAHNTVVVNETSQRVTRGRLRAFASQDEFTLVRAACDTAYLGVHLDRTLLLHDNAIVDVFRCRGRHGARFDLPLHFRGTLSGLPTSTPLERLSNRAGYRTLRSVARFDAPLDAFDVETGRGSRIHVQVFPESEAFRAEGFGTSQTEWLPMVLRRQRGRVATFVTVYQLLGPGQRPQTASWDDSASTVELGDLVVRVGSRDLEVTVDGTRHRIEARH